MSSSGSLHLDALWRSEFASFAALSQFADRKDHPGIVIDWSKFCEEGMTALARDGRDCIRAKAPGARVCYQILGYTSYRSPTASNTFRPSAVTSGPMPSPPSTAIV